MAVEQDLRVTAAQPAHANRPATTRRALDRDAGQALEHFAQTGIALFVDFLAANHDFCGRGFTPHGRVVVAVAFDLDLTHVLHLGRRGRARSLGLRQRTGQGQAQAQPRHHAGGAWKAIDVGEAIWPGGQQKTVHGQILPAPQLISMTREQRPPPPADKPHQGQGQTYSLVLNSAATLRLGLMLAEMLLRAPALGLADSHTGSAVAEGAS